MNVVVPDSNFRHYESLEEIRSELGYLQSSTVRFEDFKSVLGYYELKEKIPCSLSSCHTQHLRGYVVRLNSEQAINIGHVCGRKAFGESFELERRKVDQFREAKLLRDGLANFLGKADEYSSTAARLFEVPFGPTQIAHAMRELKDSHPLYPYLCDRARRRQVIVSTVRQRSSREIDLLRAQSPTTRGADLQLEEVEKGRISGLEILLTSPADVLRTKVQSPLERLRAFPGDAPIKSIRQLHIELSQIENCLIECADLVRKAAAFFTEENFSLFHYLAKSDAESISAQQFKWDFVNQRVAVKRKKAA